MSDTSSAAPDTMTTNGQESQSTPIHPPSDADQVHFTTPDPDSEQDHNDLRKDHSDDEEQTDAKDETFLAESCRYLLDPTKGYEGRCKKVGQYLLGCTIGEGSYGKVRLATHLISKQRVAVKVVAKKTLVQKEAARRHFRREALMMQRVYHPNVIKLYQALETGNSYYLVFELAAGGSLLHSLSRKDLKLENILLDEHSNVKLVDFGLSAVCQDCSSVLTTQCGSPLYAAPELFAGRKYGKPVDIWSLGVCLYALLAGRLPFLPGEGASLLQLYSLLLKGCEVPPNLSQPCKDLLLGMLEVHESRRLLLDEIFNHPWLTGPGEQPLKRVAPVPKKLNANSVDIGIVRYICTTYRFSEREVVASVTERKLTPAAATYHILHDCIESGRMCLAYPRDTAAVDDMAGSKETRSAQAAVSKSRTFSHSSKTSGHARLGIDNIENGVVPPLDVGNLDNNNHMFWDNAKDEYNIERLLNSTGDFCTVNELSDKTGICHPARRTTSESTDSGVGVDILPDETRTGAIEVHHTSQGKTKSADRYSYKTFIMDLRQNRQKYKAGIGIGAKPIKSGAGSNSHTDSSNNTNYVLLGHSPRAQNATSKEENNVNGHIIRGEDKQLRSLGLPQLDSSPNGSFSPTFPPIAMSGPASHSTLSSPVYSTISGLGQQCVKYNTFINSSDGSFYYSSKPIPGFRHGNRYFLHLDKSNFTACNIGVTGVHTAPVNPDGLSCECFAPEFVSGYNATFTKLHPVKDSSGYLVTYSQSQRPPPPPPPPPNSQSCSPFSYLSGEKIKLKSFEVQRKGAGQTNQPPLSPLRLHTMNSSLQIHQLNMQNKKHSHLNGEKSVIGHSEVYKVYSHTDINVDVNASQYATNTSHRSAQPQRQPVRILASLRDLYGIDPWKRSKSERAGLSKAVKKGQKNRQDDTQGCNLSPTVRLPEYNKNHRPDGFRKKRSSRSNRGQQGDGSYGTRLTVHEREDGYESPSSVSRSNVSTPLASDREDFLMPVTSVTIRTIGRP
ncbi:hypothetical protein EGW08_010690 [Elysia chlorotica]|uniref:Protein kinase domain-containing protein n=1 Tax=Elysia chlorotica TaxID=188477 RepID=A0A433TIY8_ELYCH|nr:hypothetical protein EGW08_010690 [Elysia chlorotica]